MVVLPDGRKTFVMRLAELLLGVALAAEGDEVVDPRLVVDGFRNLTA